jgi:hypothetical protein
VALVISVVTTSMIISWVPYADEEAAEFHWVEVALRAALAVAGV